MTMMKQRQQVLSSPLCHLTGHRFQYHQFNALVGFVYCTRCGFHVPFDWSTPQITMQKFLRMAMRNAISGNSITDIQTNAYARYPVTFQSGTTTIAAGLTRYLGTAIVGGVNAAEEPNSRFWWTCPQTATVLGAGYGVPAAPGAGETFTGRLRVNAANASTDIVVTLSGATAVRGSFGTDVGIGAGDRLGCQIVTSAAAATTSHVFIALVRIEE